MNIYPPTPLSYQKAIELLSADQVIAIPTETVYGVAANAFSDAAVKKIFSIKKRPLCKPLIVHVPEKFNTIEKLIQAHIVHPDAKKILNINLLLKEFWPGPLTLLLPKGPALSKYVTAELPLVGVRMPHHSTALELLSQLSFPLAAPSANLYNQLSATTAQMINLDIPFILDGGPCQIGIESTILKLTPQPCILRPGSISTQMIEKILGYPVHIPADAPFTETSGQDKSHYQPSKPLYLLNHLFETLSPQELQVIQEKFNAHKVGAIFYAPPQKALSVSFHKVHILSLLNNPKQIAQNLFYELHQISKMDIDLILMEPYIEKNDFNTAIMDRLQKASTR